MGGCCVAVSLGARSHYERDEVAQESLVANMPTLHHGLRAEIATSCSWLPATTINNRLGRYQNQRDRTKDSHLRVRLSWVLCLRRFRSGRRLTRKHQRSFVGAECPLIVSEGQSKHLPCCSEGRQKGKMTPAFLTTSLRRIDDNVGHTPTPIEWLVPR